MKMGILRIKRTVRNRERGVSIIEVELKFGISGTKGTVRSREVCVLWRSRLYEDGYL